MQGDDDLISRREGNGDDGSRGDVGVVFTMVRVMKRYIVGNGVKQSSASCGRYGTSAASLTRKTLIRWESIANEVLRGATRPQNF